MRVIYTCNDGYQLKGSPVLICDLDSDLWDLDPPICVKCKFFLEKYNKKILNFLALDAENDNSESRQKKKKGQNILEDTEVSAQFAATLDMSCVQAKVKAPEIRHGIVQKYERRRKGDKIFLVAFYACNDRFEFEDVTKSLLYCSDQKWVGELPVCTALGEYIEEDEEGDGI